MEIRRKRAVREGWCARVCRVWGKREGPARERVALVCAHAPPWPSSVMFVERFVWAAMPRAVGSFEGTASSLSTCGREVGSKEGRGEGGVSAEREVGKCGAERLTSAP